ncbi:esterase [Rhodoplanes azumiensis]|uniref:Esterase n=1 Tax=Rhodoplanes azumiensis TaxID=1897628 RepID=A0ABW5AIM9_9BRAD
MTRRLLAVVTLLATSALPAFVLPAAAQTAAAPASTGLTGPLVLEKQGSFFVGGRNVTSDTLSTLPAYAASGTITVEQMYVRYQVPVAAQRPPVTLIHGCCLTGKTWETTPDGRMGWDEYFVRRGHPTYVIDQVSRGRSSADPSLVNSVKLGKTPADKTPPIFAAGQEAAWAIFRFGTEYPKVHDGMRFPVAAKDEFYKQMVVDWIATMPTPNPTVKALSELSKTLDGTVLISHSQSGIYPFQTAALDTTGIAGIVSIEPGTCPAATGDLKPYMNIPIMVLWGDYVETSSRWAPRLKACREFAEALTKAGGRIDHVVLPDLGIKGNSHMLMQDDNSLEIADRLVAWIEKNVKAKKN